ncbi:MAG: WbqC family protein [Caldilineaceae bacterium]|nr:WbqC family protein [Caldilineaceae bacterium]
MKTGKRVAILQSNYIPWKGYFDLINLVDEFILLDTVQYTRRDWRNRNKIKSPDGLLWLTIPIHVKGRFAQRIGEATIQDETWAERHWKTLQHCYARAPYFDLYAECIHELYLTANSSSLSQVNYRFITAICDLLDIATPITWAQADPGLQKSERLVYLCQRAGATDYLSGPAAQAYIDDRSFAEAGISLSYMDYAGYPSYEQLYPPFEPGVSVLDLLFHTGPQAHRYMKSFRQLGIMATA